MAPAGDGPSAPEISEETIEVIYQATKDRPAQQLRDIDALDSKIVQVFGAASVVIALAGIGNVQQTGSTAPVMGLVAAVICYLLVGALSLFNLRPQDVQPSPNASTLWDTHWDKSPQQIKHALAWDIRAASIVNASCIARKAHLLLWAMALTLIEVLCVGFSLMAVRLP